MNNKSHPWTVPLQAPLPSQKLSEYGAVTMSWEQYLSKKKVMVEAVRKVKKSKSNRKSYHRMKNNEEKYKKNLIKKKKYLQTFRAAKKEGVSVNEYINRKKKERVDGEDEALAGLLLLMGNKVR
jgi:hypothetical protein